jgi:hypothetical protein
MSHATRHCTTPTPPTTHHPPHPHPQLHLTPPHLNPTAPTSPHLTSPHLTTPHLTSPQPQPQPHLTSPHLTSPHIPCACGTLTEPLEDDEEILLAIAAELSRFIPLVGGAAHAHTILPPLEALAQTEEVSTNLPLQPTATIITTTIASCCRHRHPLFTSFSARRAGSNRGSAYSHHHHPRPPFSPRSFNTTAHQTPPFTTH